MLIAVTNVFFIRLLLSYQKYLSFIKFLVGIILYSAIFSSIYIFFEKSYSVKLFSACSVLLSVFIRLSDGFNMWLKLFGKFLNLNENP